MGKRLYSFDIYDTLITRKTATPEGVFALMQNKLKESIEISKFPPILVQNFYLLRIQAEKVARYTYAVGDIRDITLSQIYTCIQRIWELSDMQMQQLMSIEIEIEMDNTLPISENIEKVRRLREKGEQVVLISNMYLETETLRKILVSIDTIFQDIPMYISGELGKTKGTCTLYQYVQERESVEFSDWCHFGDNPELDVEIPRRMGIHAEHYQTKELCEWEKDLLNGRENNVQMQMMLGISKNVGRRARKSVSMSYQVGSNYSAEVLLPYVLWVLNESWKKGIEKLFFVARDGYILKKIADILIAAYKYPIETSYLYGSRRAWRLPSVSIDGFKLQELFRWSNPRHLYNYAGIAQVLGMTMEELRIFLPFAKEGDRQLSPYIMQEVIKILQGQQKKIASFIVGKQQSQHMATVSYLYQEIGESKEELAFVELIGSGYSQKCLADLIYGFYDKPVRTFFYRLDSFKQYTNNVNYSFFPNWIAMGNVIEVLCGAPHGQTNGYEYKDGLWSPVFGEDDGKELLEYGFHEYLQGIEDYVKMFVLLFPNKPIEMQDLSVIELYLNYMTNAKNIDLYNYVADMPYSITGREKNVGSFAPLLSNKQLRQIYLWHKGESDKKYYTGFSLDFSLNRLSEKQKEKLKFYKRHGEDVIVRWMRKHIFQSKIKVSSHRYDLIADRIVLYGAGKRGKLLQQQLTAGRQYHADIVLWVDKNDQKYKKEGLDVQPPEKIKQVDYQQVVIAVIDRNIVEDIKDFLKNLGVEESNILWIVPDSNIR